MASSSALPATSKGQHGRAYLAPLTHRQYRCSSDFSLTPVLKRALQAWRRTVRESLGTREITVPLELTVADAVVSDGAFPEVRQWMPREDTLPRMGWVIFL